MLCVLHRVLLTRDSSDIQLTAMKVVRQIVKSAEESTSRYTKLFHPVVYLFTPKLFMNSLVYIFVAQVKAYMAAFFSVGYSLIHQRCHFSSDRLLFPCCLYVSVCFVCPISLLLKLQCSLPNIISRNQIFLPWLVYGLHMLVTQRRRIMVKTIWRLVGHWCLA